MPTHSARRLLAGCLGLALLLPAAASSQTGGKKQAKKLPELNEKVLKFAAANLGKKVGDGECAALASVALKEAGAKPRSDLPAAKPPMKDDDYVWGRQLDIKKEAILPGDVIQFRDVEIKITVARSSRSWSFGHHTAVVAEVPAPNVFVILHQNTGPGSDEDRKKVQKEALNFNFMTKGTIWVYRPEAKE